VPDNCVGVISGNSGTTKTPAGLPFHPVAIGSRAASAHRPLELVYDRHGFLEAVGYAHAGQV
jgi:hypothetical protein